MSNSSERPAGFYLAPYANMTAWAFYQLKDEPAEVIKFYWWLNLHVIGEGRKGYKRQIDMAAMYGVSERTIQRYVDALDKAGVIEIRNYPRKNGQRGQNVYEILPQPRGWFPDIDESDPGEPTRHRVTGGSDQGKSSTTRHRVTAGSDQGKQSTTRHPVTVGHPSPGDVTIHPETNSFTQKNNGDSLRSSPATAALAASQPPLIPDEVLDGVIVDDRPLPAVRESPGATAQTLMKTMVDGLTSVNVKMPDNVKARWGKEFKAALDQGFPEALIIEALRLAFRERQMTQPARFGQFLVRVQTGPELPPERLGHAEASRVRQAYDAGQTPEQAADEMRAFLSDIAPKEYRS